MRLMHCSSAGVIMSGSSQVSWLVGPRMISHQSSKSLLPFPTLYHVLIRYYPPRHDMGESLGSPSILDPPATTTFGVHPFTHTPPADKHLRGGEGGGRVCINVPRSVWRVLGPDTTKKQTMKGGCEKRTPRSQRKHTHTHPHPHTLQIRLGASKIRNRQRTLGQSRQIRLVGLARATLHAKMRG
jgi:hypothetical protein